VPWALLSSAPQDFIVSSTLFDYAQKTCEALQDTAAVSILFYIHALYPTVC
jgi:hypothetical protein